jgi:nudix-type nucleoside diphosphatase (YffH/AdpP family)
MSLPVFLFGTLRHEAVLAAVLGMTAKTRAGLLAGYTVQAHKGYPILVQRDGARAEGLLLHANAEQLDRLDFYERLFGYDRKKLTDEQGQEVWVYWPDTKPQIDGCAPWVLSDWGAHLGAASAIASAEIMALRATHPAENLAVRYPMLLSHACARLRGQTEHSPETLRRAARPDDVVPVSTAHPYAYFFGVQSDDLRFRRFDGSLSPVVRRAAFVMSDAVTLLPYDPVRDCVLLVEQFRYGLYLRGAKNCWSVEGIAGRIDPGETPVQAALREAREEAGLCLDDIALHLIGKAYPSPGCVTECLFQFVATCDLPEDDGAVNGLESEAEDIRRHIIPFAQLMDLAQSGEVQNGPLLTSIYWLALNRDRLRCA